MSDTRHDLPEPDGGARPDVGLSPGQGIRPESEHADRDEAPRRGDVGRPDWLLERIALGEVAPHLAERADQRGQDRAALDGQLARLRADDAAILERHPSAAFAEEVRRLAAAEERAERAHAPARPLLSRLRLAAAACAALLVAVVTLQLRPGEAPGPAATERFKGALEVAVFRKQDDSILALRSGDTARAGDLLQIRYRAPRPLRGVVLSIDGRGAVTLHLPESGNQAPMLASGAAVALDRSYQLDDAPDFERFLLVASPDTFSVETVAAAARRLAASGLAVSGRLDLPPSFEQADVLLRKPASSGTSP